MSTNIGIIEAAEILNLTIQQVRKICRDGQLKSEKIGNSWVVNHDDLLTYRASHTCGNTQNKSRTARNVDVIKKPVALSFFSGAMGLDLGIEKAGFEILLCCEIDKACRKTILRNKPEIALIGDIRDYSSKEIRKQAKLKPTEDIDLIFGGPPCQAFSTAGKRMAFEDKRGNVFLTYIDRIIELHPKYAIIENVRGLLSSPMKHRPHNQRGVGFPPLSPEEENGGALYYILNKLRNAGYGVSFNLYNSANFGTPQKRERVVLVCSRDGERLPFLKPTHSEKGDYNLPKWRTFKQAVKGLESAKHHHLNFPEKRLKFYQMLKSGQNWRNLPVEIQKEAMGQAFYSGGGKSGFLRRLDWNKPAPTLVTHPAMPATDLAHPVENRPLSIEEYKVIQEFPDNWIIEGSLIEQYRQIGNAVPIGLGFAIGSLIINYLNGKKLETPEDFKYSRYNDTDHNYYEQLFRFAERNKELQENCVLS